MFLQTLIPKLNIDMKIGHNICDLQVEYNKGDHNHLIEVKIIVIK